MRRHPWLVLAGGFGGLLLMMAAAQLGALFMIGGLRATGTQVERRFLERSRILEEIRSSIYLSGTVARDSLLAPSGGASSQLAEVNVLHKKTDEALEQYGKSLEKEETQAFANLRSEIEAYWRVLDRTFAWTDAERKDYRYQFFYSELIPRRTSMLQIADRVGQLNERSLLRGDEQLAGLFERLRFGLLGMIALTLLGGLALAIYTSVVVLRLQNEVRTRLEENIEAKTSLRELSAKLLRAQEEERRALSRELHDEAGQSFSAILFETENLLDAAIPDGCSGIAFGIDSWSGPARLGGRPQYGAFAAPVYARRFWLSAGIAVASARNGQAYRLAHAVLGGRIAARFARGT